MSRLVLNGKLSRKRERARESLPGSISGKLANFSRERCLNRPGICVSFESFEENRMLGTFDYPLVSSKAATQNLFRNTPAVSVDWRVHPIEDS